MKEERAEYIKNILLGVMNEEFYSKIVPRIKCRRNKVYLGTTQDETVDQDRTNDTAVLELFFKLLNSQSTQTLKLKADRISNSTNSHWPNDISVEDMLYWVRKPNWSLTDAALISVGLSSEKSCDKTFEKEFQKINKHRHPILPEFSRRLYNLIEHEEAGKFCDFSPKEFVNWFRKLDYSLPQVLEDEFPISGTNTARRPSAKKVSEKTMLKMILGMAMRHYDFDPKQKRSRVTNKIVSDLKLYGIELDKNNVLACLRKAASEFAVRDQYND